MLDKMTAASNAHSILCPYCISDWFPSACIKCATVYRIVALAPGSKKLLKIAKNPSTGARFKRRLLPVRASGVFAKVRSQ